MAPKASRIGVLTDPSYSSSKADVLEIEAAARAIGRPIVVVVTAYTEREFEPAFVRLVQAGVDALVVSGSPFFTSQHRN